MSAFCDQLAQADYEDVFEFMEIYNNDTIPVSLENWRLLSAKGVRFAFPGGLVLQPGTYVIIAKVHSDPPLVP